MQGRGRRRQVAKVGVLVFYGSNGISAGPGGHINPQTKWAAASLWRCGECGRAAAALERPNRCTVYHPA
eukprot:4102893-Prorocentrum_lima.AAC.1